MSTVVVSGRVDEDIKLRTDAVIRAAGSSVTSVIGDVWQTIVETGQLPVSPSPSDGQAGRRVAYASFLEWSADLSSSACVYFDALEVGWVRLQSVPHA